MCWAGWVVWAWVARNSCGWWLGVVAWQGDVTWRGWWLADFGLGRPGREHSTGRGGRRGGAATFRWRTIAVTALAGVWSKGERAPSVIASNVSTAITVRAELPSWRRSVAVSSVQP